MSRAAMEKAHAETTESLREALRRQGDDGAHDRGLIVERLTWTPRERLEANASFLRFYARARPEGPLLSEDD